MQEDQSGTHRSLSRLAGIALVLCYSVPVNADESLDIACINLPDRQCIAAAANATLANMTNDADWMTGAAELIAASAVDGAQVRTNILIDDVLTRASTVVDPLARVSALIEVGSAAVSSDNLDRVPELLKYAVKTAGEVDDLDKRWDLLGKAAVLYAASGDTKMAFATIRDFPEGSEAQAAYKARTLHDIAPIQAKQGDLGAAVETLSQITMGLTYYRAVANADVATYAVKADRPNLAAELLRDAEDIARAQDDGYFVAGALRQIGSAHAVNGDIPASQKFFEDALAGAKMAGSRQQIARALSRVATAMADAGLHDAAKKVLPQAIGVAQSEEEEAQRNWALYEIAGAASFAGDFAAALAIMEEIPDSFTFFDKPLRASTERDVAWGMARHGRLKEAVSVASKITPGRERIQALARIIRVLDDPEMIALPRYL